MTIVVSLFVGMFIGFMIASYIDHIEEFDKCNRCCHNNSCGGSYQHEDVRNDPEIRAMLEG